MKRDELAPKAKELYVESMLEFKEVAKQVGVNERTVRTWAKRESWHQARAAYLASKQSLKAEAQCLARGLLRNISECISTGVEPSKTYVNLFGRLFYTICPPGEFQREADLEAKAEKQAGAKPLDAKETSVLIRQALELGDA